MLISLLAIVLGVSSPQAFAHGCQKGHWTSLANSCANAFSDWTGKKDFYAWDDQKFSASRERFKLFFSNCEFVKLLEVLPQDRMARIDCHGAPYWINLDSLSCTEGNARSDPPRKELLSCETCSRLRNGKADFLGNQNARFQANQQAISAGFGQELVERAERTIDRVQDNIDHDRQNLVTAYFHQAGPLGQGGATFLAGARNNLIEVQKDLVSRLGMDCSGTHSGLKGEELVRAQSACQLIQDAVSTADYLKNHLSGTPMDAMPYTADDEIIAEIDNPKLLIAWKHFFNVRTRDEIMSGTLMEKFGPPRDHAIPNLFSRIFVQSGYSDLLLRTVMFYGLPEKARNDLIRRKDLLYVQTLKHLSRTPGKPLAVLDNGYVYGGARVLGKADSSAFDCSDFISAMLSGDRRSMPPTTAVFRDVARFLSGEGVRLSAREKPWAACFEPVRLRKGEDPQAGDIIVSRELSGKGGHIVMVKSYDRQTGTVRTLEAAGGTRDTVGVFSRPLFEPSCSIGGAAAENPVRADIDVLRIRANPGKECPFHSKGN